MSALPRFGTQVGHFPRAEKCHEPTLGKPIQSGAVVRMASLEAVPTGAES
jgi:hypothetical protein